MKQFRTVKRRAKVGERILITNKYDWEHRYKNGNVGEVLGLGVESVFVQFEGVNAGVADCEYEVIIEEVNPKGENEMNIENIVDQQLTAIVTDRGAVFTTYIRFAKESGYPEAIHPNKLRENNVVKLLAKGKHERENRILYVVETEDGTKQIIGENGLRILATKQLTDYSYEELLDAIKAKAQAEVRKLTIDGKEIANAITSYGGAAKSTGVTSAELLARVNSHRTPQQQRDEIIEQAKRDVAELSVTEILGDVPTLSGGRMSFYPIGCSKGHSATDEVQFIVNNEKRTVVALIKWRGTPDVWAKGIAKCAPTDCFNVHIGKAIALRRALGLDVPSEYLNAPQPTEVRVGDVVKFYKANRPKTVVTNENSTPLNINTTRISIASTCFEHFGAKIIDDSRDGE